jgi:hypothetical protein
MKIIYNVKRTCYSIYLYYSLNVLQQSVHGVINCKGLYIYLQYSSYKSVQYVGMLNVGLVMFRKHKFSLFMEIHIPNYYLCEIPLKSKLSLLFLAAYAYVNNDTPLNVLVSPITLHAYMPNNKKV